MLTQDGQIHRAQGMIVQFVVVGTGIKHGFKVFDVAQGLKVGLEPVDPDGGKLTYHSTAVNTTLKV